MLEVARSLVAHSGVWIPKLNDEIQYSVGTGDAKGDKFDSGAHKHAGQEEC